MVERHCAVASVAEQRQGLSAYYISDRTQEFHNNALLE
jgi:hypothetical protein